MQQQVCSAIFVMHMDSCLTVMHAATRTGAHGTCVKMRSIAGPRWAAELVLPSASATLSSARPPGTLPASPSACPSMPATELSAAWNNARSSLLPTCACSGSGSPSIVLLKLPERKTASLSASPASNHSVPEPLDAFVPSLLSRCRLLLKALDGASCMPSPEVPVLAVDLALNKRPEPLGDTKEPLSSEEAVECASYMVLPDEAVEPLLLICCRAAALRVPDLESWNLMRLPAESTDEHLLESGLALPAKKHGHD